VIRYFVENNHIQEVYDVLLVLNKIKKLLIDCKKINVTELREFLDKKYEIIHRIAVELNDEQLANATYVTKKYSNLLLKISSYLKTIKDKEYQSSWVILQDCLDLTFWIGKYTKIDNRLEIPSLIKLFSCYESLYPYKIFVSSELIVTKSRCSICGASWNSLDCTHIKGNLVWGKVVTEEILDAEFSAIAIVPHPIDKRCIIEIDEKDQEYSFNKIDLFTGQNLYPFTMFTISSKKSFKRREDIKIVGVNSPCSCGSGLKFKKCCKKKLYQEHLTLLATPTETVNFLFF